MNFSDLKNDLSNYPENKIVFVGLGNSSREDDAAGMIITNKIKSSNSFPKANYIIAHTTPENFLNQILQYRPVLVVFIDAADMGSEPGGISWIDSNKIEELRISTHTYSISLIEKYLKLTTNLEVKYLVIQPLTINYKAGMTEKLSRKVKSFFDN